jgi:beta-lactamase class A
LSKDSRGQLERWLIDCKTGAARLRAGLPSDWQVGDKTGTGDHGTANDIAILRPPGRAPLLVASYFTESRVSSERRDAVHAELGRIIAATF